MINYETVEELLIVNRYDKLRYLANSVGREIPKMVFTAKGNRIKVNVEKSYRNLSLYYVNILEEDK